jgi:hypothetical protein
MDTCEVMRAPLPPMGSLATWTTIPWPSRSNVSILGGGRWPPLWLRARRGRGESSSTESGSS